MKMVLNNGKEFEVKAVIDIGVGLEIEFENETYEDISAAYDKTVDGYSEEALRRFELIRDGEVEGTHFGYTQTQSIFSLEGVIKVVVSKENELKTEIEAIKSELPNIAEEINAVGEQADFISEDSMFLAEAVFQMDERLLLTEEQVSIISELQERLISLEEQLNALNIQPLPIGGK